jgi:hypothetical protein
VRREAAVTVARAGPDDPEASGGQLTLCLRRDWRSYILLVTAFSVDNGKSLPQMAFWVFPLAIGGPLILYARCRHPIFRYPNPEA